MNFSFLSYASMPVFHLGHFFLFLSMTSVPTHPRLTKHIPPQTEDQGHVQRTLWQRLPHPQQPHVLLTAAVPFRRHLHVTPLQPQRLLCQPHVLSPARRSPARIQVPLRLSGFTASRHGSQRSHTKLKYYPRGWKLPSNFVVSEGVLCLAELS